MELNAAPRKAGGRRRGQGSPHHSRGGPGRAGAAHMAARRGYPTRHKARRPSSFHSKAGASLAAVASLIASWLTNWARQQEACSRQRSSALRHSSHRSQGSVMVPARARRGTQKPRCADSLGRKQSLGGTENRCGKQRPDTSRVTVPWCGGRSRRRTGVSLAPAPGSASLWS